jgi:hypothetical protein
MSLFSDKFPDITQDEDIVTIAKQLGYDPGYVCQCGVVLRQKTKLWMEDLWKQYEPYADHHFQSEFKKQFTQRSWELYLGTSFLNRGFELGKHKNDGPDFELIKHGHRVAWVEAIAVRPGNGVDKVPEVVYGMTMSVPEEEMLLRVASGLDTKRRKYFTDLQKGLISPDDPYVIALDRSELGHVETPPSLILKALFGIGHMTLSFPVPQVGQKSRKSKPKSGWSMRPELTKRSGKPVRLLFFQDHSNEGISAVIYSVNHIIGAPRDPKEMGNHFIVVHNPYARNPLPSAAIPFGETYRAKGGSIYRTRKGRPYTEPDLFE